MLARIGLSQLARIDEFVENRQRYCRRYQTNLAAVAGIRLPQSDYTGVSPFIYWLRVLDDRRADFIDHLRDRGIATGIHFMPAHRYSLYAGCRHGDLTVTDRVSSEIVTLPLHSFMHESDIDYVCEAVTDFFA